MESNFQSLSLFIITLTTLSIVTTVQTQNLGPFLCADPVIAPELPAPYCQLVADCQNAPSNTAMVTQYANGVVNAWGDGVCMPYIVNGSIAQVAVFCQTVNCTGYAYAGCTGTVADLVLPTDFFLPNALNFTNLIGYGAICNKVL